jgi:hypothetical protein
MAFKWTAVKGTPNFHKGKFSFHKEKRRQNCPQSNEPLKFHEKTKNRRSSAFEGIFGVKIVENHAARLDF